MAREIERKFLLKQLPPNLGHLRKEVIAQGYLVAGRDGTQVRLRKGGRRYSLTLKRGRGFERDEIEVGLTRVQFAQLWPATAGFRLYKTRYRVPWRKHLVEIDVYSGENRGLVVAEVEFRNVRDCRRFQAPDWFGREVTGEWRYSNVRLARE
ncbi:MAG: adenylate cyclase [Chthoniobacterales bacterium]|nr:MAG: adenylate cyclase [Chthoniobacterales bacterium]